MVGRFSLFVRALAALGYLLNQLSLDKEQIWFYIAEYVYLVGLHYYPTTKKTVVLTLKQGWSKG